MPKEKQKQVFNKGKENNKRAGNKGKAGKAQAFGVPKPAIVNPVVVPPDAPATIVPKNAKLTSSKKWCLKNTQMLHPVVEKWIVQGRAKVQLSSEEQGSLSVNKHKVVKLLRQKISPSWSAVVFESIAFELTDPVKRTRDWVITRVTGWIQNAHLDDYVSMYPDAEVVIPHATPNSTDAQQYMTLEIDEEEKKFKHVIRRNMCGELSVAYVANTDIDTLLADWKAKPGSSFRDRLGVGKDSTLGPGHVMEILSIYFPETGDQKKVTPYIEVTQTVPPSINKIVLSAPGAPYRASDEFRSKIKTHDFIALVRIDTNTGELIQTFNPGERNHWVVVTRIMQNGNRVELYNPFPNRRQSYSFKEFTDSVGSNPQSGWWVMRKRSRTEKPFDQPVFGVAANNPTSSTMDAEQYVFLEGGGIKPKTKLCGEFCTAFIIGSSMMASLENWKERQEVQPADVWEITNMLDAYGFNNKDGKRSFSIDTLLRYWKKTQPNLHAATVGGDTNEGTGLFDLMSILRAYGYRREDMSLNRPDTPEPFLFAPGRDAKPLKKYFLIAGVMINGSTGRLKNKIGGGVEHWVVVDSITPTGNQFGGGGGWVELYNPFPNCWEEYSLGEFTKAFNGGTLWVKRDITPVFSPEIPAPPKIKLKPNLEAKAGKSGKGKGKVKPQAFGVQDILKEYNRLIIQPKAVFGDVIRRLMKQSGLTRMEITRLVAVDKGADKQGMDVEKLLRDHLGVKSIPEAISVWIREKSHEDETFALQLSDTLLRAGVMAVNGNVCTMTDLEKFDFSGSMIPSVTSMHEGQDRQAKLLQAAGQITFAAAKRAAKPFASIVVRELKATAAKIAEERAKNQLISKSKPIHALKPRDEYLEWIKTLETSSDRLYRIRKWGDPVMLVLGFDIKRDTGVENAPVNKAHFQAVGLYNKNTGFGAVTNHLRMERDDIRNLLEMQFDEERSGETFTRKNKMDWLCAFRGKIYLYDDVADEWETALSIKWGTIALGGNLVQVDGFEDMKVKLPGDNAVRKHKMARLVGFQKTDWSRPLDDLLAEGLVHRGFCVYKKNKFGDSPKGIMYSPLFSPRDWDFAGVTKPDAFYIPFKYLEEKQK